jgi:hypothetical protein
MSYCRWSSMNFMCDIYAYNSEDGITVHVASNRRMGPLPLSPVVQFFNGEISIEEYKRMDALFAEAFENSVPVPIGLPHDGETFVARTLLQFRDLLLELRTIGYLFPDEVLEYIEMELEVNDAS